MSKEKDSVKKERLSMFYKVAPVVGALVLAVCCLYRMPDTEQSLSPRKVEGLRRMRHLSRIKKSNKETGVLPNRSALFLTFLK